MKTEIIPRMLKTFFIIHFIIDISFAVPLFIAPEWFLSLLGWETVDPISGRLVAAALFGIGIESFLGRNSGVQAYKGMLNLKIIWSVSAIVGILLSLGLGAQGRPLFGWFLTALFIGFNVVWVYWRNRLETAT